MNGVRRMFVGLNKVAREHGVGVLTVQRIKKEMAQ